MSTTSPGSEQSNRLVWIVAIGAIVAAGAIAVVLSSGGDSSPSSSSTAAKVEVAKDVAVTGTALPRLPDSGTDPAIGRTAPEVVGVSFDEQHLAVTNDATAHVLVFLAHWCPHCQAEAPRIVDLAGQGGITVPVFGVATGTDASAPNYPPSAWLKRIRWPFPVLADTASSTAARAYGLSGYPFLVFVDANGKVVYRVSGEVAPDDLARLFRSFAAGQPLPTPGAGGSTTR